MTQSDALALLRADQRISKALATSGDPRASILVLPEPAWLEQEMRATTQASRRVLRSWETTYDLAYRRADHPPNPDFPNPDFPNPDFPGPDFPNPDFPGPDFDGWDSSFTRMPIPLADMRDWLAAITDRVLALPHDRVREIGCGTGLLVQAIAPHCSHYDASDFSAVAIARLVAWLATRPDLSHVRATHHAAHETGEGNAQPVDLVIINSVAQHFPDAAYLSSVLEAAWRDLMPGGHIVVGDTRLLGAQAAFIAAVELAKAPDSMTAGALRESIQAAWLSQSELLIDPGFFHRFARTHGGSVCVRLKSGRSSCEMTRYRCDVVLGKPGLAMPGRPPASPPAELPSLPALHAWLASRPGGGAVLRGLANARLTPDLVAHRRIAECPATMSVATLKAELATLSEPGIDPADLEALAASHGLPCVLVAPPSGRPSGRPRERPRERPSESSSGRPGAYDCGFDAWFGELAAASAPRPDPPGATTLTSNPMLTQALRRLSASLHAELARHLPPAGMPARILPVLHAAELQCPPQTHG